MAVALRPNPRIAAKPVADHVWGLYNLETGGYMFIDEVSFRLLEIAPHFALKEDLVRACNALFAGNAHRIPLDFERRVADLVRFGIFEPPRPASAGVLLVEPPYRMGANDGSVSPKGLCYLSTALEVKGLGAAAILDLRSTSHMFGDRAEMISYFTRYASSCNPVVVGVSAVSATIDNALLVARLAKTFFPESYIVMGGPHASYEWHALLSDHSYIDAVVRGEGDLTFPLLVERVAEDPSARHDFSAIPGIAWRGGRQPVSSGWSSAAENLDALGWPDVYANLLNGADYEGFDSPHFISSRGCPFKCSFCSTATFAHRKIRFRSVESVLEEISYYWEKYGFTDFAFDDDIFTVNRKRTLALCEAIERAPFGGRVNWGCSTRLDCIDDEIIEALHQAGCKKLFFGIESGDPDVQFRFGKGRHLLKGFREKIEALYERQMEPRLNFILGLPGESMESVGQIVELIRDFPGIPCSFSFLTIFPGTPLAERLDELGIRLEAGEIKNRYSLTAPTISSPTLSAEDQIQVLLQLQWSRREIEHAAWYRPAGGGEHSAHRRREGATVT